MRLAEKTLQTKIRTHPHAEQFMPFKKLRSSIEYQGKTFTIRRDYLRTPDNRETIVDIVEHPGSAILIPIDASNNILFVRQYRHSAEKNLLELPAGKIEPGENPTECAAREIREETGMQAGVLTELGEFYLAPGYSTEFMVVFLATNLSPNPLAPDANEFLRVEPVPVAEAIQMAERGEVPDAKSLAALFLAKSHLEKWLE